MTSICHMSLADAFVTRISQDVQKSISSTKRLESGLGIEVVPIYIDRQTFMENYLQHLYLTKHGIFCKLRSLGSRRQNMYVYDCERSCFSKGASTGDPTKTRANGCKAYVSFGFEEGATINICVLRYRLTHTGHNPANRDECKVNRIDSSLRISIQEWFQENIQISDILQKIAKWNKVKGNSDYKDRRFFPSLQDIQQMSWGFQKNKNNAPSLNRAVKKQDSSHLGSDTLYNLLKTKYRDMYVFYQASSCSVSSTKPLIVVLQAQHQRERYKMHGNNLIFISKNFKGLCSYGCAIYSLVVRDDDVAYPVAFIITNTDEPNACLIGVHAFQRSNSSVRPRAFFIDKDLLNCCSGLKQLFPEAKILVPKYQVMQAVHSWLKTSAVAEPGHREVREVLLKYMLDLSNCGTEEDFQLGTSELEQKVDYPEFTLMLQNDWLSCGEKWCDYGRSLLFTSTQNAFLVEKLFLNLEHQLLNGMQSLIKPDDVVDHISKFLNQSKGDQDGLVDMEDFLEGTPEEQAENLLQDGWGRLVMWTNPYEALIPHQSNADQYFNVRLITMECDCPFPAYKGLCVHLNLAQLLAQKRVKEDPTETEETVDGARIRIASEVEENRDFLIERLSVTTFHTNIICVTSLSDFSCTCKASFFGYECVGVLLSKKLHPHLSFSCPEPSHKPMVEYTVIPADFTGTTDAETISAVNSLNALNSVQQLDSHGDMSSKKLVEDLFLWSQSPAFTDSPSLNAMLRKIHMDHNISLFDDKSSGNRCSSRKKDMPYNAQKRIHSSKLPSRESPRKSSRIKGV